MFPLPEVTALPSTRAAPALSSSCPSNTLSSDVLPVPLGPSPAMNPPGDTVRSRSSHRTRSPNASRAPVSETAGGCWSAVSTAWSITGVVPARAQCSLQLVDGIALPGQIVGAVGQRLGHLGDRDARTPGRIPQA